MSMSNPCVKLIMTKSNTVAGEARINEPDYGTTYTWRRDDKKLSNKTKIVAV